MSGMRNAEFCQGCDLLQRADGGCNRFRTVIVETLVQPFQVCPGVFSSQVISREFCGEWRPAWAQPLISTK